MVFRLPPLDVDRGALAPSCQALAPSCQAVQNVHPSNSLQQGAEAVAATAAAAAAAAAESPSAPLLSVIAEILRDRPAVGKRAPRSAMEMVMDAEDKVAKCKLAAEGPPRCQVGIKAECEDRDRVWICVRIVTECGYV